MILPAFSRDSGLAAGMVLCHVADMEYGGLGPNADTGETEMKVRYSKSLCNKWLTLTGDGSL